MWEVFTEGRMPFEKNTNYEVVTMVTRGHRLHRPKLASKYVYDVMLRCWQEVWNFFCVLFYFGIFRPLVDLGLIDEYCIVFMVQ